MPGIPALRRIRLDENPELSKVQDAILGTLGPLASTPIVNGALLNGVSIVNGAAGVPLLGLVLSAGANIIAHGLGRIPLGWMPSRPRPSNAVIPWTEVLGGVGFQNSWANFGSGYNTAAYKQDFDGKIWTKGLVKSGTIAANSNGAIFTLPAGLRTSATYELPPCNQCSPDFTAGITRIDASGRVIAFGSVGGTGTNTYWSLDGLCFSPSDSIPSTLAPGQLLWETSAPDSVFLYLTTYAAMTVDLWVF